MISWMSSSHYLLGGVPPLDHQSVNFQMIPSDNSTSLRTGTSPLKCNHEWTAPHFFCQCALAFINTLRAGTSPFKHRTLLFGHGFHSYASQLSLSAKPRCWGLGATWGVIRYWLRSYYVDNLRALHNLT